MTNILITNKTYDTIKGTYFGSPYTINLKNKKDELQMLTLSEVNEVLDFYTKQLDENPMLKLHVGSVACIIVEEGHTLFEYNLKVTSIDEEGVDDCGNYFCIGYGEAISKEDYKMVEEFTSRIDTINLNYVL